jgi:hypothetical protein
MDYYQSTAKNFAARIHKHFESEETLKALFHSYFPTLPFDRTDHWNGILWRQMVEAWEEAGPVVKGAPTQMDINKILRHYAVFGDGLDYNLFTQVMANLQSYAGFAYQTGDAEKHIAKLKTKWDTYKELGGMGHTPDPFEPKAKMQKEAKTDMDAEYNADLSAVKALRIIAGFGPLASWRVSPKGSTPAFADSKNISMIGLGGDRYLRTLTHLKVYYITWGQTPQIITQQPDGSFKDKFIPYPFISKSGGQILNEVLFSRQIASLVWGVIDATKKMLTVIPRMSSVMVVSNHAPELEELVKNVSEIFKTPVHLYEGERPQDAILPG